MRVRDDIHGEVITNQSLLAGRYEFRRELGVVEEPDHRIRERSRIVRRDEHDVLPRAQFDAGKIVRPNDCHDRHPGGEDFQTGHPEAVALQIMDFHVRSREVARDLGLSERSRQDDVVSDPSSSARRRNRSS